jgi:predicted aspartyl protease
MNLLKPACWLLFCAVFGGCAALPKSTELEPYNPECLMDHETAQVPLIRAPNSQWRVTVDVNGVPGIFILDTGADFTVITPQFARKLGLWDVATSGRSRERGVRPTEVKFAEITYLRMGDVDYLEFYAPILNLDHINRAMNTEVAGILGNNILNKTAYQIDWNQNTLTLRSRSAEPPAEAIPISIRKNRIYFKGLINGREAEFALDTGAYRSTLKQGELDRLQIPADQRSEIDAPEININSAQHLKQTQARLDTFQVGPMLKTNYLMLTWDHNVLGMDLLAPWILKVDARRGWMSLAAPAPQQLAQ